VQRVAEMETKKKPKTAPGFGWRLKQQMARKGVRLKDIAAATGKSIPAVHKWTRGGDIDHTALQLLARYLEVNWVWLRYGEEAVQEVLADYPVAEGAATPASQWAPGKALRQQIRTLARAVGWEWNIHTGCLFSTPEAVALFGRPVMTIDDLLRCTSPRDREHLQDGLAAILTNDAVYEVDCRIDLPEGGERWLAHRCQRITNAAGQAIKVIGASMDISRRKQTETVLLEQRQQLELALSMAQMNVWELDLETWAFQADKSGLPEIQERLQQRFGGPFPVTFREAIGFVHPDDRNRIVRTLRNAQQTGIVDEVEFRLLARGRPLQWLKSRLRALPAEEGKRTRVIGITAEATEQKMVEERLASKRRRLELALEAAGLGEWELDLASGEVHCTDRTAQMLGFDSAAELKTEADFLGVLHPADREKVRKLREDAQVKYQATYRVLLRDGQVRRIREYAIFSDNRSGSFHKCFGAVAII
jgi:PAS domain-containing protein